MTKARDIANIGTALTTVSATELGYLDGTTSAIQTQIDAKATTANIVSTAGGSTITVASGTTVPLTIQNNGTGNSLVVNDVASDTSPVVINADGQLLVGTTTDTYIGGGVGKLVAVNTGSSWIKNTRFSADAGGPTIGLAKSRNAAIDGQTVVASGDAVGALAFYGSDGTQFIPAGNISAAVDGTPGTNDMPGRLMFGTTPDGTATPVERMRIDNAGNVGIGTTAPAAKLDVVGAVKADNVVGTNLIAGGSFDIWQRGTTAFTANNVYTSDRFFVFSSSSYSLSQETSVIPDGATNAVKITATAGSSFANMQFALEQSEVEKLAGKTVTFSVYLRANATYNGSTNVTIKSNTTGNTQTGGTWTTVSGATSIHTPSTSAYTRVTVTGTIPTTAKGLAFYIGQQSVLASGSILYIALAKAEIGTLATDFVRLNGTIQGELAACQRYFEVINGAALSGSANNSTTISLVGTYKVVKRVDPTLTGLVSALAINNFTGAGYVTSSGSAYTFNAFNAQGVYGLFCSVNGFTGLTALSGVVVNNASSNIISASAEL